MSRFNTGNKIDSDDLKDLSDNAKNIDLIVNSNEPDFVNRLGTPGLTWRGVQDIAVGDFSVALRAASDSLNSAKDAKGFADMAASATASGFTGVYKSKSEGLSSTSSGQLFWVADDELILYLNNLGSAEIVLNHSTAKGDSIDVLGLTQAGDMLDSFSSELGAIRQVRTNWGRAAFSTLGGIKLNGLYRNSSGSIRVFLRGFGMDNETGELGSFYLKINSFESDGVTQVGSVTLGPYAQGAVDIISPIDSGGVLFGVELIPSKADFGAGLSVILIEGYSAPPLESFANIEAGDILDNCVSFFSGDGKTLSIVSDYLFADGVISADSKRDCINSSHPLLSVGKALYMKISARYGVGDSPIFTQTSPGVDGRIQLYANRVEALRNGVGYINLFIEGSSPQLPPYPFSSGEDLHIVMDYRDEENLSLYFNGKHWGGLTLNSGVAQLPSKFIPSSNGTVTMKKIAVTDSDNVQLLNELYSAGRTNINPIFLSSEAAASEINGLEGFSKDKYRKLPPASLTKMMTASLALESGMPLHEYHEIIGSDATSGSGNNLKAGDEVTLLDLLHNMMLPSSNVSATAVARIISGTQSDFVRMMNDKAAELGMVDTEFKNPHGLNKTGHSSTAMDMLKLLKYASGLKEMRKIWSKSEYIINIKGPDPRQVTVKTSVKNIDDQQVLGGKTGTLGAMSSLATFGTSSTGGFFYGVVIEAPSDPDRYADMNKLIKQI